MLIGDILLAQTLSESLAELRTDSRAQADLFSGAPPEVQESARRFFTDTRNKIDIRQGFTTEPPRSAMIVIVLAGEEESNTPIGGAIDEGPEDTTNRHVLSILYEGTNSATVVVDQAQEVIRTEVWARNAINPTRVTEEEFTLAFADFASLTLLRDAINAMEMYSSEVATESASLSPTTLQGGQFEHAEYEVILDTTPSVWGTEGGTFFRGTWKITALSVNANVALWLHAFVKWALLKERIQLEIDGLHSAQLAGGDFEPVPEWMRANDVPVFARGVLLTAIYAGQFVDREDVTPIKYTDVHETTVGFIE